MKKNMIKILAFSFFAFCMSFNLSAQISKDSKRSKASVEKHEEQKQTDPAERMEKRANRYADRLEMDAAQRAKFVPAQVEFFEEARMIRKSDEEQTERKARLKVLKNDHQRYLSSFLSTAQMDKIKKMKQRKKAKRQGMKGKKGKKAKYSKVSMRQR